MEITTTYTKDEKNVRQKLSRCRVVLAAELMIRTELENGSNLGHTA